MGPSAADTWFDKAEARATAARARRGEREFMVFVL